MTEVGHKVFQSDIVVDKTDTTPALAYTIATAAELTASGDYIIICSALHGADSGTAGNNQRNMALYDNDVQLTGTQQRITPTLISATDGNPYSVCTRFTKAASGDVTLKIWNPDSQNVSAYGCEAILILLDDLIEGTDFLHVVNTTANSNVGPALESRAGMDLTVPADSTEKWMAFGFCRWDIDTVNVDIKQRIDDGGASVFEINRDSDNVNETFCALTPYPINGIATAKAVQIEYGGTDGTNDILHEELFLLRLGTFKKGDFAKGGSGTVVAASTYVEIEELAGFTANHTGDHCMIAGMIFNNADNTNLRSGRLTSQIGAEGEVVQSGNAARQIDSDDMADLIPVFHLAESAFTDSDALNFDIDAHDSVNATNETVASGFVSCFTWERKASKNMVGYAFRETLATDSENGTGYASFGAVTEHRILGSELDSNSEYILLCRCQHGGNTTGSENHYLKMHEVTGGLTENEQRIEPRRGSTNQGLPYGFMEKVTTDSSPNDFEIRGKTDGVVTTYCAGSWIMMIKLDDLNPNDWIYAADDTGDVSLSPTLADGVSIELDVGNWLIFAFARFDANSISHHMVFELDVGGLTRGHSQYQGEHTAELHCRLTAVPITLTSVTTVKIKYGVLAGEGSPDLLSNRIFAMRLDAFEDHAFVWDQGVTSINPHNTEKTVQALAYTTDTNDTRSWGIVAQATCDADNDQARYLLEARQGTTQLISQLSPGGGVNENEMNQHGTADESMWQVYGEITSHPDAVDLDLDLIIMDIDDPGNGQVDESFICAWTWQLKERFFLPYYSARVKNINLRM